MADISSANVNLGGSFHGGLMGMVLDAGFIVQLVLISLLFFSVVSWAVIFLKYRMLGKAKKDNSAFLELYMRSSKLSEVFAASKKFVHSNVGEVFRAGYAEQMNLNKFIKEAPPVMDGAALTTLELRGIDNIERTFNRATALEIGKLESALGFLATTGSVCPFIGLFGTVWGIMDTFRGIGAKGSATLAIVAPGISEALVATAAGLVAAIPAVVFYNYFQNNIKAMAMEMDNFVSEMLNILERHNARR